MALRLRTTGPVSPRHPLLRILLAIACLLPAILVNNAISFLVLDRLEQPILTLVQAPLAVAFVWALALSYRAYCRRCEGRNALELGGPRWAPELRAGVAIGGGMVVLIVATLAALGSYSVTSVNQPIVLLTRVFRYGMGSFVEELLFTIILFRLLEEFAGTVRAYAVVSVLFGIMHLGNDNATMGSALILTIMQVVSLGPYILTRRIWLPWGLHFAWNYFQAAIFGLNNSGMAHQGFLNPLVHGPTWLTGGSFGLEGSVLALALHVAVGIPFLVAAGKRGQIITRGA